MALGTRNSFNMATAVQNDVAAAVEHEISCPICLDEFEEPKCLPSCAHNVCQHCLEGMVKKRNNAVECPVCRVESIIPQGGVAAFPKNHLLVRLIERAPGRKEKQSIKEAIKNCNEKLEGAKTALKHMEDRFQSAKTRAEETKQRIKSLAENVVTMVREQEQKMLGEIDQIMSQNRNEGTFETHKSNATELCENASGCIQTVQDILQNGELSDLRDLKDPLVEELNDFSASLENRIFWANCEFTQPCEISVTDTHKVEKFVEDGCLLGKLAINTGVASTPETVASASVLSVWDVAPVTSRSIDFSRCGSVVKTLDSSSCRIAKFAPFSVAASRSSGHFVALDEEKKRVHIFNEEGESLHTFRIMYGVLRDIAVSNENEIVVVNRESNRLLHYDINGSFKKKFVTAPKEKVNFTSLTVDTHGRFIITSSPFSSDDTVACVLVYSPSGKLTLSFGEGILWAPEKAVFMNGKFYVADIDRGGVMVFDKSGNFLELMDNGPLHILSSIAADYANGYLLVSDHGNSEVQIYSQDGQLLHTFQTELRPGQIAFTKNYRNLLICCEYEEGKNKIQLLTYF